MISGAVLPLVSHQPLINDSITRLLEIRGTIQQIDRDRGLLGSKTILYDAIIRCLNDITHLFKKKTHRMYNTKNEGQCKLRVFCYSNMTIIRSSVVTNIPCWWEMLMVEEAVHGGEDKVYGNSVLSVEFGCEPNAALKILHFFFSLFFKCSE